MTLEFDTARHPHYKRYATRWEYAFDFWRGGINVLDPDHDAVTVMWVTERPSASESAGGEAAEEPATRTKYQWHSRPARSYLYKHVRETAQEYEDRHRRVINLPLFQYVVNKLAAGVLRDWPTRSGVTGFWETFHGDVDKLGTDIEAFMRRALSLALVFGRVHAICDQPRLETPPASKAEDPRTIAYLVTPLDLVDWSVDEFGEFNWVVVREAAPDRRIPGDGKEEDPGYQYRVWYRDGWQLFQERGRREAGEERYLLIDEGTHPVGRVPIATLFCTRMAEGASMACETPLSDTLDLNRHLLNELSELGETDRAQAFDILAIPTTDGMPLGQLDIGYWRALSYSADGGTPVYLGPNPENPKGRWQRITEKAHIGRQLAAASRGKAEFSKEERSAAALAVEGEDTRNQLSWWSKALQVFDNALHETVGAWQQEGETPTAAYSTKYDVKGTLLEVQEFAQLAQVPVVSEARKALSLIAQPIFRKMLREGGATPEEIEEALADLKEAAEKEPEPVIPPFMQADGEEEEEGDEKKKAPPFGKTKEDKE